MVHKRHIILILLILFAFPQLVLASKIHTVRKSESLNSVARKYHVPVDELKSVNNINGARVSSGTRLIIPSRADAQAKKIKNTQYKVVKGDTLIGIAKKTGVKTSVLKRLNGLNGGKLRLGQLLALNEVATMVEEPSRTASPENRPELVNRDLLNEREYSDTLAELTDINGDRPVDLAKKMEENSSEISELKKTAYSFLGARYRFGGNSRKALDCSSFVQQVFREQNVDLPRTAREQFNAGTEVMRGDLRKGDLVFFQTYAPFPSHVGIYLGNRKMIHASSRDHRVVISSMDTPYYLSRFLGARRIGADVSGDSINFNKLLQGVDEENESDADSNDTLGLSLNIDK